MRNPLRIYPSLPDWQNIPPFSITICNPRRIYNSLQEYTPLPFQQPYATLPDPIPPSENTPPPFLKQLYVTLPDSTTPSL